MNCPKCRGKAINFITWSTGGNAFSANCQNCGVKLLANHFIYMLFSITIIACFILIPFIDDLWKFIGYEPKLSHLKSLVLLPVILIGGVIAWFFGGYKVATNT